MFARRILEVLYSPVKAFEEIIKNPDIKGPLFILLLVLIATTGAQYVTTSKLFLQARTPAQDDWTESISLWTSNGNVSTSEDRIIGNHSIEASAMDKHVSLSIPNVGPFNFSEDSDLDGLSFRIKWFHENGTFPSSNATLKLFSGTENRYFSLDLISDISASNDEWANLTVNTGSDNHWLPVNSPNWENITGLGFMLIWSITDSANRTMKIDDLYFFKYVPFLETNNFSSLITPSLIDAAIIFFITWGIDAGVLLVTAKLFQENTGPWKTFFVIVGYVFIVTVIYILASAIMISTLPTLKLPMQTWPPTTVEELQALQELLEGSWHPAFAYQLGVLLPYIIDGWIALLCAVAIHFICGITWKKAAGIAVIASVLSFFIRTLFI